MKIILTQNYSVGYQKVAVEEEVRIIIHPILHQIHLPVLPLPQVVAPVRLLMADITVVVVNQVVVVPAAIGKE